MAKELKKIGITCTVILDAAVGLILEKIDFVLLGAEGVVESGGIINKIGTTTMCLSAKTFNKPVYVAVESFKFVRFYPLNNRDIPDELKVRNIYIFKTDR
jgi:translation initiation factor eIF-2B subunit alpha